MFLTLPWQPNDTLICYSECAYLYTQTWFFVPPIAFYIAETFSDKCFFSPFYFRLLSGRLTKGRRSQGNKHKQTLHTQGEEACGAPQTPRRRGKQPPTPVPASVNTGRGGSLLVFSGQQTRETPKRVVSVPAAPGVEFYYLCPTGQAPEAQMGTHSWG